MKLLTAQPRNLTVTYFIIKDDFQFLHFEILVLYDGSRKKRGLLTWPCTEETVHFQVKKQVFFGGDAVTKFNPYAAAHYAAAAADSSRNDIVYFVAFQERQFESKVFRFQQYFVRAMKRRQRLRRCRHENSFRNAKLLRNLIDRINSKPVNQKVNET